MSDTREWQPITVTDVLAQIRFDRETKLGSVLDVIQLVTGCGQNHTSRDFKRFTDAYPEFHVDVHPRVVGFKFPGRGQKSTPAAPIPVLVEIAWLLDGKNAARFRREGVHVFCRALGGDISLIDEIKARHGMMEGTLEQEALLEGTGVTMAEANGQALTGALDIEERRMKLNKDKMDLDERAVRLMVQRKKAEKMILDESVAMSLTLKQIAIGEEDPRIRVAMQDAAKNALLLGIPGGIDGPLLLTNGENKPISISTVAAEMGLKLGSDDLASVGRIVAKAYRAKNGGKHPEKHDGLVNGHVVKINTYFEKDRPLIVTALEDFNDM